VPAIKLFTPSAAAAELGIGRTKLLDLVRHQRIRCRMLDGRIRIPIEALQEFRDALPEGYVKGASPAKRPRAA
jgi:excisionase family DNA binding protein